VSHTTLRRAATVLAAGLSGLALGATGAQAAPALHCEASALRASVAGQAAIEPVTTGRTGDCATTAATPSVALPALLDAQALIANTAYDGAAGTGSADGGIAHLRVLPTRELIAQLPTEQFIDQLPLQSVAVPLPLQLLGLPPTLQVDVKAALKALVPEPSTALLSVDLLDAHAAIACQAGAPVRSGSSQVAGVKLLGQDIGVDGAVSQALTVIGGGTVDPSRLDPGKLTFYGPLGELTGPLLTTVLANLKPLLAALPPITLPASVIQAQLRPGEQIDDGQTLTQRALHASLALAGRPILDAVLGEAQVGSAATACATPAVTPPAAPKAPAKTTTPSAGQTAAQGSVAQQILACTDRKLVLVDVLAQGSRVKLLGAANRAYVGRRVAIRLRATGRVVAHAKVRKDGSFETTAPRPARSWFATHRRANRVRYRAEIGKELSLPLKLQRRLIVSSLTSKQGHVTIAGRVVRPLTTPVATIRVVRRVSCHKVVLVKRFKPRADGTFRVTVKAPKGQAAAVYRLATYVREKPSNPRRYPTFTLPRGVALNTR